MTRLHSSLLSSLCALFFLSCSACTSDSVVVASDKGPLSEPSTSPLNAEQQELYMTAVKEAEAQIPPFVIAPDAPDEVKAIAESKLQLRRLAQVFSLVASRSPDDQTRTQLVAIVKNKLIKAGYVYRNNKQELDTARTKAETEASARIQQENQQQLSLVSGQTASETTEDGFTTLLTEAKAGVKRRYAEPGE